MNKDRAREIKIAQINVIGAINVTNRMLGTLRKALAADLLDTRAEDLDNCHKAIARLNQARQHIKAITAGDDF